MFGQERKWVWIVLGAMALIGVAVLALRLALRDRDDAFTACVEYLETTSGDEVNAGSVMTTVPEAFFESNMRKRFRSTCTYGEREIVLESDPFGAWRVASDSALD